MSPHHWRFLLVLCGSEVRARLLSVERYKFDKEKKEQEQSKVEEVSDEKPLINKEEPTRV